MPFCPKCGKTATSKLCDTCNARAENAIASTRERLERGQRVFLYRYVYLPVDSVVNGEPIGGPFNISAIQTLGGEGWDVAGTIAKTTGVALENRALGTGFTTYAGGLGGNTLGAYVLLKRELQAPLIADDELKWLMLTQIV